MQFLTRRCPNAWAREPYVQDVIRAWKFWQTGQLEILYPRGVPALTLAGVEFFDNLKNTIEAADRRLRVAAIRDKGKLAKGRRIAGDVE